MKKTPEKPRERFLSREELGRLSSALNEHELKYPASAPTCDAIRLLLLTGARRGEVLSARWSMFQVARDGDSESIVWTKPSSHTKQKKTHVVALTSAAIRQYAKMYATRKSETFLFPSTGAKGHLTEIKRAWRSIASEAGLEDLRIHDIRHSFASFLVNSGASLPMIGKNLGHASTKTTERYAHIEITDQVAAAERADIRV